MNNNELHFSLFTQHVRDARRCRNVLKRQIVLKFCHMYGLLLVNTQHGTFIAEYLQLDLCIVTVHRCRNSGSKSWSSISTAHTPVID